MIQLPNFNRDFMIEWYPRTTALMDENGITLNKSRILTTVKEMRSAFDGEYTPNGVFIFWRTLESASTGVYMFSFKMIRCMRIYQTGLQVTIIIT